LVMVVVRGNMILKSVGAFVGFMHVVPRRTKGCVAPDFERRGGAVIQSRRKCNATLSVCKGASIFENDGAVDSIHFNHRYTLGACALRQYVRLLLLASWS
jgi:hypothetical protein